jgi:hypothetical protein
MIEGSGPAVTIALRDGSELRITPEGIHIGDRFIEIGRLQDARQVAPDPLTIAVRASGERQLVEFQPQQPQEGAVALEAIYRIRPDLRPAGFTAPTPVPGAWPPAPPPPLYGVPPYAAYGPYGSLPYPPPQPGGYPPPGYGPYGPPPMIGYPPAQDTSGGKFTPFPRDIGSILTAVFALFGAHWRKWLLLGFLAASLPTVLVGAGQAVYFSGLGLDLWASPLVSPAATGTRISPFDPFGTNRDQFLMYAAVGTALILVGGILSLLQVAALGIAARDAVLGRPVRVGASLAGGLRRFFPVFGTSFLMGLVSYLVLLPALACLGVAYYYLITTALNGSSDLGANTAAVFGFIGVVLIIPGIVLEVYLSIRWYVAPYVAATERLGGLAAMRKSWQLTRGQWWHTFLPGFIIGLLASVVSIPASFTQFISLGVYALIALPLVVAVTAPFSTLVAVIVLYDLRLRQEGYQAVAQQEGEPQPAPAPTIQG